MAAQLAQRLNLQQLQQQWSAQLNPILINPANNSSIIPNVQLKVGVNVINHLLGRMQQGWSIVDKQAACNPYRSAPFNDLTLTLTSDAVAIVNIEVF